MSCVRAKVLRLLAQQSARAMFRDLRAGAEAEECCCAAEQCSMGSTAPWARALILRCLQCFKGDVQEKGNAQNTFSSVGYFFSLLMHCFILLKTAEAFEILPVG